MYGPAAAAAVAPEPAKRMVFRGMGFGVTQSTWFPDVNTVGTDYTLPEGLKPLARHKDDFTVIQNLYHQYSRSGHSGSTFWLTGANQFAVPGKSFHNTVSMDQVAATKIGLKTRFSSLQLSGKKLEGAGSGHGPGLSLAWDHSGKPMPAYETPNATFHKLFSNDNAPLEEQRARMAENRSVLDTVLADARAVRRRTNQSDHEKLDEYLESIRDIETRIAKEENWLGAPRPRPDKALKEPGGALSGIEEVRVMYDLMAAALQVDATRVITFGSNLNSMHTLINCPTLVAGGGSGIKQGQHLVMNNLRTPLCNLWLGLLRGSGIKAEAFGDSTGIIDELFG
ncbi:DUF1552 domain-containing protein [Rhodopirellula sallentina]|uniref:Protein containing DUF1552 n=1 Tax=Rhodopirellula sallentina SM41 TaxID=1263870 RepID=M5U1Z3_9BACT|nr:DUF1552 domain-containing protein [Rhodopirellula sallentina]EMI51871.1 protein containing DUF1552 [Rhodopirellula sallentina SM41]